jgi:hypothetical protein
VVPLTTQINLQGMVMTAGDFKKILQKNGFAGKDTTVNKGVDYLGEIIFEVITTHGMNIGNLIDIEKKNGLALQYVMPYDGQQMYCKFGKSRDGGNDL